LNLRPLDPQSWAVCSPEFANDRILSATNDLDTSELSRTSAKPAVLLHRLLHDLSTVLRHRGIQRGGRLGRCGSGRPHDLSCVRKIAQVGRYAFGEFRFAFVIQHHAVPVEASLPEPGQLLRHRTGFATRACTSRHLAGLKHRFHPGRNGRAAGSCPRAPGRKERVRLQPCSPHIPHAIGRALRGSPSLAGSRESAHPTPVARPSSDGVPLNRSRPPWITTSPPSRSSVTTVDSCPGVLRGVALAVHEQASAAGQ